MKLNIILKKGMLIALVFVMGAIGQSVLAQNLDTQNLDRQNLVTFRGAIGDIPVANVAGTPNPNGSFPDVIRNIVRGVDPAGQIWVISDFRADVKVDGRIRVDGRGLLLGRQYHWH